ncbi:hypothetical protein pb186bvf_003145 [Paramecium bursaria]
MKQSLMEIYSDEAIIDVSIGPIYYQGTDQRNLLEIGVRNDDYIVIKINNKINKQQNLKVEEFKTEDQLINNYQNILFQNLDNKEQKFITKCEQDILVQNFTNPHKMKYQHDQTFYLKKLHLMNNTFKRALSQSEKLGNLIDPLLYNNKPITFQTKKPDQLNILSLQASFAYGLKSSSCLSVTIKNNEEINYQQLEDVNKLQIFQMSIKQELAKQFKISPKDIHLLQIVEGSIKIYFMITNEAGAREEIEWNSINEIYRIYHYSELVLHKYFQDIQLSADDFDPQYNMQWKQNHPEFELRGPQQDQIKYFFPRGWKGYALKVKGKYDEGNDDWILMNNNPNQWHIMYHGTNQQFVGRIVEQGFKVGERQKYHDTIDIRLNQIVGDGIYFSNHIEVAELYADPIQIGDYNYRVVFQSRVRPLSLKQIYKVSQIIQKQGELDWDNDYFVVNKPEDIRPYRILLKKEKQQPDKKDGKCKIF